MQNSQISEQPKALPPQPPQPLTQPQTALAQQQSEQGTAIDHAKTCVTCGCCGFGMILWILLLEMIVDIGVTVAACCDSPEISILVFTGVFFDLIQIKTRSRVIYTISVVLSLLDELALFVLSCIGVANGNDKFIVGLVMLPLVVIYRVYWYFEYRKSITEGEIHVENLNGFHALAVSSSMVLFVPKHGQE
jgi:hypothetical protein